MFFYSLSSYIELFEGGSLFPPRVRENGEKAILKFQLVPRHSHTRLYYGVTIH